MIKIRCLVLCILLPCLGSPIFAQTSAEDATRLFIEELTKPSPVSIPLLKQYLAAGANVKATASSGWSLLFEAAFQGDTALLNFCLRNSLPVNAVSKSTYTITTPLYWAVDKHNAEAEKILRRKGAKFAVPDGYATQIYDSGNKYTGYFKNGAKSGKGTFYYASGDRYEGNWAGDLLSGYGTFYFADGSKYQGTFVRGMQEGHGTIVWHSGGRYEGNFKNNAVNGKGTMTDENGGKYVGEWKDGKQNGTGTYYWKSGDRYEGNFEHDEMNGKGIMVYANGDKYVGEWKDGKQNGSGTYYWKSGMRYEGEWKDGKKHGNGKLYDRNNKLLYQGRYEDGEALSSY